MWPSYSFQSIPPKRGVSRHLQGIIAAQSWIPYIGCGKGRSIVSFVIGDDVHLGTVSPSPSETAAQHGVTGTGLPADMARHGSMASAISSLLTVFAEKKRGRKPCDNGSWHRNPTDACRVRACGDYNQNQQLPSCTRPIRPKRCLQADKPVPRTQLAGFAKRPYLAPPLPSSTLGSECCRDCGNGTGDLHQGCEKRCLSKRTGQRAPGFRSFALFCLSRPHALRWEEASLGNDKAAVRAIF
jgi:hypothetical protein